MKTTSKITALVLSMVLLFTMTTPAFAAPKKEISTRAEYVAMISEETAYPALTTAEFLKITNAAGDFFRLMTNGLFPPADKLNVSFDKFLLETNHHILFLVLMNQHTIPFRQLLLEFFLFVIFLL